MARRDYNFLGISPTRAFLICEDLKNLQRIGPDELPHTIEFFMNPDSLKFRVGAAWPKMDVPGLSHQVIQYSHTESNTLSFELVWHKLEAARRQTGRATAGNQPADEGWQREAQLKSLELGMLYKDWLYSLTLPIKAGRAPSRVTLVWPGFLNVVGVIEEVDFTFDIFSHEGDVMGFTADVKMLELRRNFVAARDAIRFFDRKVALDPNEMVFVEASSGYLSSADF